MALEPINIFASRVDVAGVAKLLRTLAPSMKIVGADDEWETIEIASPKKLLKKSSTLVFTHSVDYYAGPRWPLQVRGMLGYFGQFPEIDKNFDVLKLISTFCFALATECEPELDLDSKDERVAFVLAVTKHLDGVIFQPSCLRDAQGKVIISADGSFDKGFVMPSVDLSGIRLGDIFSDDEHEHDDYDEDEEGEDDEGDTPPPEPGRIARRALSLCAVSARALLEQDDPESEDVKEHHRQLCQWVAALELDSELEAHELRVIKAPVGSLDPQTHIDSVWRLEGLGILAWVLHRAERAPYDDLVNPQELFDALGFLNEAESRELIENPKVRSEEEIDRLSKSIFGLHWRVRDFTMRPQSMNFAEFARDCWFGPLEINDFRLLKGDLAIGDWPVSEAPEQEFRRVLSATMERHIAVNWLQGFHRVYSKTDCST